jgi:nucleoredoxin
VRLLSLLLCLTAICSSSVAAAKLPPLVAKDVSLMLRSGYSVAAVEQELATRHFIGAIDPATEKTLVQAGAPAAFLASLKSGAYAVPAGELAAVEQSLAANERRRALEAEESSKLNAAYQNQLATTRTAGPPPPSPARGNLVSILKGDLVTSKNGVLSAFNDQALDKKKLIGLYFSARWCGPCRKFTPDLVEFYNRVTPAHPEFEIIFVSSDRSAPAMEAYMRDMQMPWPAVHFDKLATKEPLRAYAGSGIPCLVIIDAATGQVVSDSYEGKQYLGPAKVVADLERIFGNAVTAPVARR